MTHDLPFDLRSCLRDLIQRFRIEGAALSPEEQANIQTIHDLRAPCQVTVFAFDSPRWTNYFITHAESVPDGRITIHSGLKPWTAFDALEAELADPLWQEPQPPGNGLVATNPEPGATLSSLVEQSFLNIHHNARAYASQDPDRPMGNRLVKSLLGPRTAVWDHHGDPANIDWDAFLSEALAAARRRGPTDVPFHPDSSPGASILDWRDRYPGRGAYHHPALKVGKLPAPRLQSLLSARDAMPGILVLEDKLGPHELLVTHNGFLGLMTKDTEEALRWLNLAMAGFRQHGYLSRLVHETALGAFHKPNDWLGGWGGGWPDAGPGRGAWDTGWGTPWLSDDEYRACLRTAEILAERPYASRLSWILQAEAHLTDHEFPQSLIFSWALIEDAIAQRWDRFLVERNVSGSRRKTLQSTREWTFQGRLDAMQLAGEIPLATYERLVTTKRVRNKAMHGTRFPNHDQTLAALDIAEELLLGSHERLRVPLKETEYWGMLL